MESWREKSDQWWFFCFSFSFKKKENEFIVNADPDEYNRKGNVNDDLGDGKKDYCDYVTE